MLGVPAPLRTRRTDLRILLISDTHAPRRWTGIPDRVRPHLEAADVVLHAGDVCVPSVLVDLAAFAPLHVVRGNNDGQDVAAWGAPDRLELALGGLAFAMVHDSGPRQGRSRRLRTMFPEADVIVFGHSHVPWDESEDGVRMLNPGSPTDRRRQPHGTVMMLEVRGGVLGPVELVEVT